MKTQSSVELRLLLKIKDCSSVDVCSVVHLTLEKPGRAAHRCDNKQDVIKIRGTGCSGTQSVDRLYSDRPKVRLSHNKKMVKFLLQIKE